MSPFLVYEIALGWNLDYGIYLVFVVPPVCALSAECVAGAGKRPAAMGTALTVLVLAALLAPGAVYGDTAFGVAKTAQHYGTNYGFASFGGASVGENAYFINGMNVTNFRNGLGGSTVPFEFFDQFQIKSLPFRIKIDYAHMKLGTSFQ